MSPSADRMLTRWRSRNALVGDAEQLGQPAGGVVPPLVAQDRHAVLVAPHRVAERVAHQPLLVGQCQRLVPAGGEVAVGLGDRRQFELVHEGPHRPGCYRAVGRRVVPAVRHRSWDNGRRDDGDEGGAGAASRRARRRHAGRSGRRSAEPLWEHRLAELGKVADHVGANWLALYPYGPDGGDVGADVADAHGRRRRVHGRPPSWSPTAGRGSSARSRRCASPARRSTETTIAAALNAPGAVDPDLVIVLGPSHRLPPSLVWELAYSELVFVDVAWGDLQPAHLERAIDAYAHRHRRFGGLD